MCSAFTPDCGYDNSAITLIRDVYCPNTKCLSKLCLHEKTFQSIGRSDYQCRQCVSVCQVHHIPFEDQRSSFFLSPGQGVNIFDQDIKSIQDVIGDVSCPGNFWLNLEKCESIGGYATTPRSNYGCGKCGACLLLDKVPFTLQEHVKTTKTDKTRFFFAKKKMLPDKQLFINAPFQSTKHRRKELCVDNIKTIGDVLCPTCRNENCVDVSTQKRLVSTTVKSAKPAATS